MTLRTTPPLEPLNANGRVHDEEPRADSASTPQTRAPPPLTHSCARKKIKAELERGCRLQPLTRRRFRGPGTRDTPRAAHHRGRDPAPQNKQGTTTERRTVQPPTDGGPPGKSMKQSHRVDRIWSLSKRNLKICRARGIKPLETQRLKGQVDLKEHR